jgi:hypothetical protein
MLRWPVATKVKITIYSIQFKAYKIMDFNLAPGQSEPTSAVLEKAYKKKKIECHPDKHPDDTEANEKFQEIGKVYDELLVLRKDGKQKQKQ